MKSENVKEEMIVEINNYEDRNKFSSALLNSGYTVKIMEYKDSVYRQTFKIHFWKELKKTKE